MNRRRRISHLVNRTRDDLDDEITRRGVEVSNRLAREQGERDGITPVVPPPVTVPLPPAGAAFAAPEVVELDDDRVIAVPTGDSVEARIVREFWEGHRPDNWPDTMAHPSGELPPTRMWTVDCPYCGDTHHHRAPGVNLSGCGRGRYEVAP